LLGASSEALRRAPLTPDVGITEMNNQEISEYSQYIENLDRRAVLDISNKLDKEKHPEKWAVVENYLNKNRPELKTNSSPSFISKLWKGDISLVKTFWLCWLLPAIAFPVLKSLLSLVLAPILGILYLFVFFILSIAFSIYQIICVKGLWSSATKYEGKKIWSLASKVFIIFGLVLTVYSGYQKFTEPKIDTHDPGRTAEKMAIPTKEFPLSGFYKDKPTEDFGFAIGPNENGTYYISFCGPGGCFKPGTYLPDTTIIDDSNYGVIDNNTIKFRSSGNVVRRATGNKR
jgi:hypothetical protein